MNEARPRIIRFHRLPARPWANGEGTTTEILRDNAPRFGAEGDVDGDWSWRVSVASIDRPGPFSAFPGVERMTILIGPGSLDLRADGEVRHLEPGESTIYPGTAEVAVQSISAPSRVLNVMLRSGRAHAEVGFLRFESARASLICPYDARLVAVVLEGECRVAGFDLGPLDAVTLADRREALVYAGESGARLAVLTLQLEEEPPPVPDPTLSEELYDEEDLYPEGPDDPGPPPLPWTPRTRFAYLQAMDALLADLRRHARLVAALDEKHFHHDPATRAMWFTSVDLVQRALNTAHDAEVGWTTAPSLPSVDLSEEDDDAPDLGPLAAEPGGDVISLVGRWDVRVRDMDAFLAAGREAYSRLYDLEDAAFAEASVSTPTEAAAALVDSPDWPELHIPGVSDPAAAFWQFVQHDGSDMGWVDEGDDPFDILDGDED